MAEPGEMEVLGAHSIEGLGMAADPVQKKLVPTIMLALGITELHRDSDGEVLAKVAGVNDFFGSVLLRDMLDDWNLAKDLGEFLIRIEPDSIVGRVLLVRAYRRLGGSAPAIERLKDCRDRISSCQLQPSEAEVLLPVLAEEEKLLSGGKAAT